MWDVVRVAREHPRRYGKNGEMLIEYEGSAEHEYALRMARERAERRRTSVASGAEREEKVVGPRRLGVDEGKGGEERVESML